MEKKEKKLMLVLPFTVLVAICGIMTYFACSADDDWEGSPEYLKTHAPMLTRAGVDVGGETWGATLWVDSGSDFTTKQYISGFTGPKLALKFTWDHAIAGSVRVSATGSFSDYDENVYRGLTATVVSTYCPPARQYPDSTLVLRATVNVTGSKYINYVNGHYDRIEKIDITGMDFNLDIKGSTHWELPENSNNDQLPETTQDDIINNQNDTEDENE